MKKFLFAVLRYSGLAFCYREYIQKNKVSVLVFHDIDVKTAELIFGYLSQHYAFISLKDLIQAIQKKDGRHLPEKALVITFDDGHVGNYHLLPVFKKYKVPVTIFLCSGIIGTNKKYWFLHEKDKTTLSFLKSIPNKERLKFLSYSGFTNEGESDNRQALSIAEITEMTPYIDFQSHTVYHPILPQCDEVEAKQEISESKITLEKTLKKTINAIAYPNGDYGKREIQFTKESKYLCGLTVKAGFNTIKTNPFELKRLDLNDSNDINEIIVKSSGIQSLF